MSFEPQETLYDHVDVDAESWDDLQSEVQEDLTSWINTRAEDLDADDKVRLLKLYTEERFKAWDCPLCMRKGEVTRVFKADVEDDEWQHFQGSCNQDFSFFSDRDVYTEEFIDAMCDSCRCHG